jgi:hypothetical protein
MQILRTYQDMDTETKYYFFTYRMAWQVTAQWKRSRVCLPQDWSNN